MKDELLAFRMSVKGGASETQLILEQQIIGILKLLNGMAPYHTRLDMDIMLRFAGSLYEDFGEFGSRECRGKRHRQYFFTYKQY